MPAHLGLLLIGHGTRDSAGRAELLATARLVAERWPGPVEPCFLELAQPPIEAAVAKLVERGADRLVAAPLLLFAAGHARQDVPAAVAAATARHGNLPWRQAEHLGLHPSIVELSARRFWEAVEESERGIDCRGVQNVENSADRAGSSPRPTVAALCSDSPVPHSALRAPHSLLLLVGRGSRDATATAEMHQFASLRSECTPVAATRVCFAAMAEPLLDDCLAQLADQRCSELAQIRQIVVQPHLLFAGELLCGIRQAAARFSSRVPQWDWRITEHLGCDDRLVRAIIERAISAAGDWIYSTPTLDRSVNRQ